LIEIVNLSSIAFIPNEVFSNNIKLFNGQGLTNLVLPDTISQMDMIRFCFDISTSYSDKYGIVPDLNVIGRISIFPSVSFYDLLEMKKIAETKISEIEVIKQTTDFVMFGIGEFENKDSLLNQLFNEISKRKFNREFFATQIFIKKNGVKLDLNKFELSWIKHIGRNEIYFDKNERVNINP